MALQTLPQQLADAADLLNVQPLQVGQFAVEIDGVVSANKFIGGFRRVGGLEGRVSVLEIPEGGYAGKHRFPERIQSVPLVLSRGLTTSRALWDWYQSVINWEPGQQSYLRTLSIYMIDDVVVAGEKVTYEAWRWDVYNAWPSEWRGPAADSLTNSLAVESLTVQHSGISEPQGLFSNTVGEVVGILS